MLPLPHQRAQLQWQHGVLSNEQLTWLAALPAQGRAHDIELWHGSAQDPITGWISSPQDAADHLARQQARIGLVGHTHRPLIAENNGTTIQYDEHPRRRPSRSAQAVGRARITQMARTRPRSGKREVAHGLTCQSTRRRLRLRRAAPGVPAGYGLLQRAAVFDVHPGCLRRGEELLRGTAGCRIVAAANHRGAPTRDGLPGGCDGPLRRPGLPAANRTQASNAGGRASNTRFRGVKYLRICRAFVKSPAVP